MKTSFLILVISLFSLNLYSAATPNPEMKKVLDALKANGARPLEKLTADQARAMPSPQAVAKSLADGEEIPSVDEIKNIQVDGAEDKIPARYYKPKGKAPFPVVLFFHGGGWVMGKNDDYDATLKNLANKTGAIFLAVEYRKAPEHKFPAAHDDAYAAYLWTLKNASDIGGDPKKIAVAGESAGGNLAINVSIRARDQKVQMPIHQLLVYPVAGTDPHTKSYEENANARPLSSAGMGWYIKNYLRSTEDLKDKRINLVKADLKKLPPTTIITAELDPLRSEGSELADQLEKQGVDVTYKDYRGVTHEFFSMAPLLDEAKQAQEVAAKEMKESLTE